MSQRTRRIKKALVKEHRRQQLDRAIGKLLVGETTPDYVHARAEKLKAVSR